MGESLPLSMRVAQRLRAGALVMVVQESDEALAVAEVRAAAETCSPVKIISVSNQEAATELEAHKAGRGTLILTGFLEVYGENPMSLRMIREVGLQTRSGDEAYSRLVLIEQPHVKIPQGIVGDSEIIGVQLPTIEELRSELDSFVDAQKLTLNGNGEMRYALAGAVSGLPRHEASRLFARSFVEKKGLDPVWLRTEKARRVTQRLGGALTFESTDYPDVGGLDLLQKWMQGRKAAFESQKAIEWGLPRPKGVLLLGVPGGGKSLTARLIARTFGVPLLRLDPGKLFGSLVGQSEAQTRMMIDTATACAPCVVWIDEIEKGFGGQGGLDGGTSTRVLGTLLTWLQEDQSQVFKIATANKISALPPELMRKGRFDEIFFVDTPTALERRDILKIHLGRRKRKLSDEEINTLAEASQEFTGAELEQAIIEGMFDAYNDGPRELTKDDVLNAIKLTVPLVKTMPEEVKAIRSFGQTRCRPASSQKAETAPGTRSVVRPPIQRPSIN